MEDIAIERAKERAKTCVKVGDSAFNKNLYRTAIASYTEALTTLMAAEDRQARALRALKAADDQKVRALLMAENHEVRAMINDKTPKSRDQMITYLTDNMYEAQNRAEEQKWNLAQYRPPILLKRATAYNEIGEWSQSKVDCMFYLKLRSDADMEINFVYGKALSMVGDYQNAITHIKRWMVMYKCKNEHCGHDGQGYSNYNDAESILRSCNIALNESSKSHYSKIEKLKDSIQGAILSNQSDSRNELMLLDRVFQCAYDICTDPSYLSCSMSHDLYCEPVVIPSGISYEQSYIDRFHKKDPITVRQLDVTEIYPNRDLKQATEHFKKRRRVLFRSMS